MTTIECGSCGNEIEPGQPRKPDNGETKHDYCVLHDSLFEKYHFYITNPPHEDGYGVSFWRVYGETEFPVMYKSDMILVSSSQSAYSGSDTIEPSDDFFTVVAYSIHDVMAFTGGFPTFRDGGLAEQVQESFEKTRDMFYRDTRMPEHEQEVGRAIVAQIIPQSFPYVIPELEPIRDFADECTGFGLPEVHPELRSGEK